MLSVYHDGRGRRWGTGKMTQHGGSHLPFYQLRLNAQGSREPVPSYVTVRPCTLPPCPPKIGAGDVSPVLKVLGQKSLGLIPNLADVSVGGLRQGLGACIALCL